MTNPIEKLTLDAILTRIREQLDWRAPGNGKPVTAITLTRGEAEHLVTVLARRL